MEFYDRSETSSHESWRINNSRKADANGIRVVFDANKDFDVLWDCVLGRKSGPGTRTWPRSG